MRMSRRAVLGALGTLGLGGLVAAATRDRLAPEPEVVPGTTREVEAYGELPRQLGEWWLPPDALPGRLPTVVLVHGGYWRPQYDLTLEHAVAADLAARGFLVWNVEYRPASDPWPATLLDVAAAYDHLERGRYADRVDPRRLAVVGHSAGGHLALWLAARDALPPDAPGAGRSTPLPAVVVAQAPVAALAEGARRSLGGGAVQALMGGEPDEVPERYAVSDPLALLPTGVPTVCVHGTGDDVVPLEQSETYVRASADARLVTFDGGHFEHLDPSSRACAILREALPA